MADRLHSFTIGDIGRENARTFPDYLAIVCGEHRLSYRQFDQGTNRAANLLLEHGIGHGDRVAWVGLNCHLLLELIFACSKVGAIAAPLNWRLTGGELRQAIEDLRPSLLVEGADAAEAVDAAGLGADRCVKADAEAWSEYADDDPELDDNDERPVLILMTAAFDGRARAAQLTQRGIVHQNLVLAGVGGIAPDREIYLVAGPMFHIGALLKCFALLHWGGRNIILDRPEPAEACALIERERCTSALLFGPTIQQMVELNRTGTYDLTSLGDTLGGSPPEDVAAEWYEMTSCSPTGPRGSVGYGATETVGMVTYEARLPPGLGRFGRPSPVVALRIVSPEGEEVPVGETGEIAVRGPQVMAGYLGDEPLDPRGWRMTGDLGRREADGTISFLGPNLDIIKTGMENVYPVEVEGALQAHPLVTGACVIGVPDPTWGQSIKAFVQLEPGAEVAETELIEHVRSLIASYKKPRSIVFVETLPRNAFGIVDRAAVKAGVVGHRAG